MDCKPRKSPTLYSICIFVIVLVTGCALLMIRLNIGHGTSHYLDIHRSSSAKVHFWSRTCAFFQEIKATLENAKGEKVETNSKTSKNDEMWLTRMSGTIRRMLSGLGSSPPRCTAKCGRCSPCKPVHVTVPPGTSLPTEYYPVAWRCKCGNKLYMP